MKTCTITYTVNKEFAWVTENHKGIQTSLTRVTKKKKHILIKHYVKYATRTDVPDFTYKIPLSIFRLLLISNKRFMELEWEKKLAMIFLAPLPVGFISLYFDGYMGEYYLHFDEDELDIVVNQTVLKAFKFLLKAK